MNTCPLCSRSDLAFEGHIDGREAVMLRCGACGRFGYDAVSFDAIRREFNGRLHLLSAGTRAASDTGKPVIVEQASAETIASSARPRGNLSGMLDRTLLLLSDRVTDYWRSYRVEDGTDWPLISAKNSVEFNYFMNQLGERALIDVSRGTITLEGWQRVESLRESQPRSRQAFVAMWFDSSLDQAWLEGIKPGVEDTGLFDALRVDQVQHNEKIDDRIVAEIKRSGLLIADFTGGRGGVYFEAGLAMGLGIPVIWTCREDQISSVHFDTRQYNHITWASPADLREKLKFRILASIPNTRMSRDA